jgi:hypothetical protein
VTVIDGEDMEKNAISKCGFVSGCVQSINGEKGEPERLHVEVIDYVFLWNVTQSMLANCNFVIGSKFNDQWLTKCLYWVESCAVIAYMARFTAVNDKCSWSGGWGECG